MPLEWRIYEPCTAMAGDRQCGREDHPEENLHWYSEWVLDDSDPDPELWEMYPSYPIMWCAWRPRDGTKYE